MSRLTIDPNEAADQFREAIRAAGLRPPEAIQADGKLHRFATNGKPDDDAGWYIFYGDRVPAGAFGDWRSGCVTNWRADIGRPLCLREGAAYRLRFEAIHRERKAEDEKRRAEARDRAVALWNAAGAGPFSHPYLAAKCVRPHGLRVHNSALLVPLRDGAEMHGMQFIGADGGKRFLTGSRVRGCYYAIGEPNGVLCIAEGFATGASIHEATGHAVAVAFNSGNLMPVAQAMRERMPGLRLVLCADDDAGTPGNPGLTSAREAAEAVGASLAVPEFGADRAVGATDFNDLHRQVGAEAVRSCIARALSVDLKSIPRVAWAEPGKIVAELKPVPTFDADVLLPDVLRAWVMDEAERMPCPPDFVAVAALVTLGSIIGARCAIRPKSRDSWLVVSNLWGGIVGDPSAKKSPAWTAALAALERLNTRARQVYESELVDYESSKVVFNANKEAIEGRIKTAAKKSATHDLEHQAQELREHSQNAPTTPTLRRYKTNDTTVEKLGELLRENPSGILVLRDELVGLLASWDREGREGERAFFLEAWNGNQSFDTDRIGRGHISVPNLCVSIFGGIQPDKLVGYLEQAAHALANDGMLQRFQLLVFPDPCPWEWRDRSPDKRIREAAFGVFEALADFDPVAWGAAPADDSTKFAHFSFGEDAQAVCIEWSADLHRIRIPNEEEPIVRQHLAKFDKLFPALALVFHLVDCAANGTRGPVTKDAALRAAAWCEYLEAHARRCYGLLKDDGLRAAQALVAKLERGSIEDGFTLRDVRRNQWRSLTADDAIQAALDWLEDDHWVRGETTGGTGPGTGRRTVRYYINPAITRRTKGKGI